MRMDTRSAAKWIVAILVVVVGAGAPVFAGQVYVYGGNVYDRPIPANPDNTRGWMQDAIINVPDHFNICDLDVGISVTHTKVFDLQIFLQSPAGKKLCLNMYNPFNEYFDGEDYIQTIFDDEAQLPIEHAAAPFTGRFKPRTPNLLKVFDDQDAFGSWRLQIYDYWYADTGKLDSFELIIETPEPATAILLLLGTGIITLFKPRRRT